MKEIRQELRIGFVFFEACWEAHFYCQDSLANPKVLSAFEDTKSGSWISLKKNSKNELYRNYLIKEESFSPIS